MEQNQEMLMAAESAKRNQKKWELIVDNSNEDKEEGVIKWSFQNNENEIHFEVALQSDENRKVTGYTVSISADKSIAKKVMPKLVEITSDDWRESEKSREKPEEIFRENFENALTRIRQVLNEIESFEE